MNAKANTSSLATVATTGSYTDLTNKPTIPSQAVSSVAGRTGVVTLASTDLTDAASLETTSHASATYAPVFQPVASYTYNSDGTVATATEAGVATTFTYNADLTVHTMTRAGVTRTFSYNADRTVAGAA